MWFGTQAAFAKAVQAALGPQLNRIEAAVNALKGDLMATSKTTAQAFADLQAQITANTNTENSALQLINGIAAQLKTAIANGASPDDLEALVTQLQTSASPLAAAVAANTVTPPPPPPPAPPA